MDACIDSWRHGVMDGCLHGLVGRCKGKWMHACKYGLVGRSMSEYIHGCNYE